MADLFAIPLTLREANALVRQWHRHHKPVQGYRFAIGVVDQSGRLRGCCICGRPVGRKSGKPSDVLEVTRVVTDGVRNGCSFLYGAASRAGKAMGFEKIQTFILADEETGQSLRASGWTFEGISRGGEWKRTDGSERRTDQPNGPKGKWSRLLNSVRPKDPLLDLLG